MKLFSYHYSQFVLTSSLLLLILTVAGCHKKTAIADAPPTPEAANAVAAPTPAVAVQVAQLPAFDSQATVNQRLAAAQSAMRAKDYQKAAAALFVPVNRQAPVPMTGEELMSLNDVKSAYMNQLTAAANAGDANAKTTLQMILQQQNR